MDTPLPPAGVPVLVLAYRRVQVLAQTLEALRLARPSTIYVNVDGPREGDQDDQEQVNQVRQLLDSFKPACPLRLRYVAANRGLGEGVCEAIDWFFAHETRGIIVEDDVYISPGSLVLAERMLSTFEREDRVGSISLFNPVPKAIVKEPNATYRFSSIPSSQYWGTWRNRWQTFRDIRDPQQALVSSEGLTRIGGRHFARWYAAEWDHVGDLENVRWEGRWLAAHFARGWVVPTTNENFSLHLGFNALATNSLEQPSWYPTQLSTWDRRFVTPSADVVDQGADHWYLNRRLGLSVKMRLRRVARRAFPRFAAFWRGRSVKVIQAPLQGETRSSVE